MTTEAQKEIKRLRVQEWRENNRERHREYGRRYLENNPGANNKSSSQWRKTHVEEKRILTRQRRARLKEAPGTISTEEWETVVDKYGPACLCCKEVKPLTMDHVVPIVFGGFHTVDNVQPLCLSCNSSKGTKTIDYRPDYVVQTEAA